MVCSHGTLGALPRQLDTPLISVLLNSVSEERSTQPDMGRRSGASPQINPAYPPGEKTRLRSIQASKTEEKTQPSPGALERGAHHHLVGGFLERRELLQRARQRQARVQRSSKRKVKAKASRKRQRQAKEERHTKARGALLHKACGEVFKELQGIQEWFLLYQVHLYMFLVLCILL
jgi:hypothetical protein